MNAITQEINLNLIPGAIPPRISVSQYDDASRSLVFRLYNGAVSFTPGSGTTVQIRGTKPDNKGFEYAASIAGSTVTAAITDQMTAVAGDVRCEIVLKDSTKTIGTGNFVLEVERAALGEDTDISETVIPDIIDAAEANAERAEAAADRAEEASVHAPYIGQNEDWYVWDTVSEQYVDSGVDARGDDGEDGTSIANITKTGTAGLVDTYTVTLTDGTTYTFTVTNGQNGTDGQDGQDGADGEDGVGIADIEKTSTVGLVDTYTITLTDQTTYTFTVTNGQNAIPGGGTTGQVLTKLSNTSGDAGWQTPASGSSSLADLTDTTITTPADGEVLAYNATSGKWENTTQSAGSLAGLSDTTITSPTAAQPLTYDATNSKWINGGIIPAANGGTGNATGYVQAGRKANTNIGNNATAEGQNTTASGNQSHAEGYNTQATGHHAHVEGENSKATNGTAHAEGANTTASGMSSHAQGNGTTASGSYSSAAGRATTAGYIDQFVVGKYNNNKSTSIFEVGIGTGSGATPRINGLELDTSGNLTVAGNITDGNGNTLSALASYLEQTVTLSTSASTTVTFTDSSITANSFIEYACSQWDLVPESITGAAGSCTIVLPKVDSAQSVTVRIYVR